MSSEESSSHDLSPRTREKTKIESKYRKSLNKVMNTFIDRVDKNSNSSGSSCSGGEDNNLKPNRKKRSYNEFLKSIKKQISNGSNINSGNIVHHGNI